MKRIISLLFLINLLVFTSIAQTPLLTLNDVVSGGSNYSALRPERLEQLQWADEEHYSYIKDDSLMITKTISGKEKMIMSLSEFKNLNPEYKSDKFPRFSWQENGIITFQIAKKRLFYNTQDKSTWEINYPAEATNIDFSYAGQKIAYTIDNNLYYATKDDEKIRVSNESDSDIISGQTVHRSEFGITKGTFWSPDGNALAFYRKDESMVENYPLVDINAREATVKNIKYPMAGMTSHQVTIGVYNTITKKTTFLQTGTPDDHYLSNIAWSPDGNTIYVAEINRGQDTMHLNSYDANNGVFLKTLFTETDAQYIEPQTALVFLPNDPSRFVWQSRKDGYNHLYLYTIDGDLVKQITKGDWEVTQMLGFDKSGKQLFFTSTEASYIQRQTYSVSLKNQVIRRLTKTTGVHQSTLSPNGKYLLDTWSDVEVPLVTDLITTKNSAITTIFTAPNPYADFTLGETQLFTIKSTDSTLDLSCRMILPPHFDKTKKYPAIIYVYGGPHSQLISQRWKGGVQMWQHYMAQKGYIMFTLDNRGTSYRGADFEQIIHRELGKYEMQDQMQAYDFLSAQDYIDANRIGVFGWSFGGFMTTSLMTHYPEAFKVGVAGGPVIDWSNYEVMYGERYMDMPQENPEGYEKTNLTNYAKNLQGRLLMIHGGQDPVVVWQHSQKFARQCVMDGKPLDYFVYPTHEHNVRGKDRVHLMAKITQYFDDFL